MKLFGEQGFYLSKFIVPIDGFCLSTSGNVSCSYSPTYVKTNADKDAQCRLFQK